MRKLYVIFAVLLSSIVIASCGNQKCSVNEKKLQAKVDSLISENDSLREEKGKLIYLILKLKGGGLNIYNKEKESLDSLSVKDKIKNYGQLSIKQIECALKWAKEMEDMSF